MTCFQLQVTVAYRKFDLIIHPVLNELIKLKWQRFGRYVVSSCVSLLLVAAASRIPVTLHLPSSCYYYLTWSRSPHKFGAWKNTILNFLFIILWTIQGILVEYDQRHKYILPAQWWRIVLFILAVGLTGWQIKDELFEFFNSKKSHRAWKEWRQNEIEEDIFYSHPRWPEEEQYLRAEIGELDKITPQYFNDFWNIFDWIVYTLLLTCIITHLVDIFAHTDFVARLHIRIMAITVILIWLRLMKNARAFATLGPFIVMLSKMAGDVVRFAFLYLEFYIPYACAFWMLFGGDKVPEDKQGLPDAHNYTMVVNGYGTADALMFSMFRLTLVDEYDYDGMKKVDYVMADILVGTWLALSAILCLNLFIALLSDTFQRVYDNAQANAVMQKAITILSIEDNLNKKRRNNFRKHIHSECCPKVDFYDDDTTEIGDEDLKKVTIQIKEDLDDLREAFQNSSLMDHDGHRNSGSKDQHLNEKLENEMDLLRDELRSVRDRQEDLMDRFKREMSTVRRLLHDIAMNQLGPDHQGGRAGSHPTPAVEAAVSTLTRTAPAPQDRPTYSSRRGRKKEERTTDEEWERSEQQRKKELRRLRQQLAAPHPFSESDGAEPPNLTMTQTSVPVVEVSELQQPSITSQATVETELEPSGVHTTIRVKPHIQETAGDTEC